jgi:hypothetical protein
MAPVATHVLKSTVGTRNRRCDKPRLVAARAFDVITVDADVGVVVGNQKIYSGAR